MNYLYSSLLNELYASFNSIMCTYTVPKYLIPAFHTFLDTTFYCTLDALELVPHATNAEKLFTIYDIVESHMPGLSTLEYKCIMKSYSREKRYDPLYTIRDLLRIVPKFLDVVRAINCCTYVYFKKAIFMSTFELNE